MKNFQQYLLILCAIACLFFGTAFVPIPSQTRDTWQGTRPVGKFLSDSLKLGYPVRYALSLKHPAEMEVLFPDSTYTIPGFEWVGKEYFPTRTNSNVSLDSVIYTLTSFNLAAVQRLSLPIYIVSRNDCTAVFAEPDTIYLHSLLPSPDSNTVAVRVNVAYTPVQTYYNYGYTILIGAGIILVLLLINQAFGKRIRKLIKLYTISREHSQFSNTFDRYTRNIQAENAMVNVENAVILWKNYMESLEDKPFSTYTTKEIIEIIPNEQLAEALQHTDRVIYGQMASEESIRYTRILAYVAKRSYIEKRAFIEKQNV